MEQGLGREAESDVGQGAEGGFGQRTAGCWPQVQQAWGGEREQVRRGRGWRVAWSKDGRLLATGCSRQGQGCWALKLREGAEGGLVEGWQAAGHRCSRQGLGNRSR